MQLRSTASFQALGTPCLLKFFIPRGIETSPCERVLRVRLNRHTSMHPALLKSLSSNHNWPNSAIMSGRGLNMIGQTWAVVGYQTPFCSREPVKNKNNSKEKLPSSQQDLERKDKAQATTEVACQEDSRQRGEGRP